MIYISTSIYMDADDDNNNIHVPFCVPEHTVTRCRRVAVLSYLHIFRVEF